MSVADVASRIQQIQSQIALLSPSTTADPAASAAFAGALADAGSVTAAPEAAGTSSSGQAVVDEAKTYRVRLFQPTVGLSHQSSQRSSPAGSRTTVDGASGEGSFVGGDHLPAPSIRAHVCDWWTAAPVSSSRNTANTLATSEP